MGTINAMLLFQRLFKFLVFFFLIKGGESLIFLIFPKDVSEERLSGIRLWLIHPLNSSLHLPTGCLNVFLNVSVL